MRRAIQIALIIILIASTVFLPWSTTTTTQASGLQDVVPPTIPKDSQENFVYVPLIANNPSYRVSGQILDANEQPLAGVSVVDTSGLSVTTDANGIYQMSVLSGNHSLAPEKDGMRFNPSVIDLELPGTNAVANFDALAACSEAIINGGFELDDDSWELPITARPARIVDTAAHTGLRALKTGITNTDTDANIFSYSSGRQLVTIPGDMTSARLRMWLYPIFEDLADNFVARPTGIEAIDAPTIGDIQYVVVLNPTTNELIEFVLSMQSDARQWGFYEFNLDKYIGKTIKIEIGTYNDGYGGVSALFADDVSLELCDDGTEPTPVPVSGCNNAFVNSTFEATNGWSIPITTYMARYSAAQVHTGEQSMRTGITNPLINVYSYSDAFQMATIPATATSVTLNLWMYPVSSEPISRILPDAPESGAWSEQVLTSDLQYILVLDMYGNIIDHLYWDRQNTQSWTNLVFDLTEYRGRTIRIQFGTYNDGIDGQTAMFVDDAFLDICFEDATPTATVVPTDTPVPTVVPTGIPTPLPGVCTEKFENTTFETTEGWGIPITAFSAGYSTTQFHTGLQSMRNGILVAAHNRFSYSDAYQSASVEWTADSATIGMWIYPITTESVSLLIIERPTSALLSTEVLAGDVQYVLILDQYGNWIDTLLWTRSNAQTWTYYEFDVSDYIGSTIRLQFGVYNNGSDGITAMFVDDTTFQVCP